MELEPALHIVAGFCYKTVTGRSNFCKLLREFGEWNRLDFVHVQPTASAGTVNPVDGEAVMDQNACQLSLLSAAEFQLPLGAH